MHTYYDAKEMLHKELNDIVQKGELSAGSLETIDKLLNAIKNADKIIMYERFDDGSDYSYAPRKRDAMGRYSRDYRDNRDWIHGRYSYDEGKDEKIAMLRDMLNESRTDDERRMIQKLINHMEA